MQKTKTINEHLLKHQNNVIEIFDVETSSKIESKTNLEEILSASVDLDTYFQNLRSQYPSVKTFGVQLYNSNGSTHKRKGFPVTVTFSDKKQMPKEVASVGEITAAQSVAVAPIAQTIPTQQVHQFQQQPQQNQGMGFGMSMPQMIDLHTKAARYEDVLKQLYEARESLAEEKKSNSVLTIDLRKANADLAVADQVKTLAVQAQEMSQKGAMDNPAVLELISQIGKIAPSLIQAKTGGMAGVVHEEIYSDEKAGLIDLIKEEKFTDSMSMKLVYVAVGLQNIKEFDKELKELVEKHNIKNLI